MDVQVVEHDRGVAEGAGDLIRPVLGIQRGTGRPLLFEDGQRTGQLVQHHVVLRIAAEHPVGPQRVSVGLRDHEAVSPGVFEQLVQGRTDGVQAVRRDQSGDARGPQ